MGSLIPPSCRWIPVGPRASGELLGRLRRAPRWQRSGSSERYQFVPPSPDCDRRLPCHPKLCLPGKYLDSEWPDIPYKLLSYTAVLRSLISALEFGGGYNDTAEYRAPIMERLLSPISGRQLTSRFFFFFAEPQGDDQTNGTTLTPWRNVLMPGDSVAPRQLPHESSSTMGSVRLLSSYYAPTETTAGCHSSLKSYIKNGSQFTSMYSHSFHHPYIYPCRACTRLRLLRSRYLCETIGPVGTYIDGGASKITVHAI
ncbi:hypothetical protein DFH09DRAFT_97659 [Mycena vulgaris]|nr:hypothetical protein DFH09DRAFT_97659 [Mycena vulgaris]